MAIAWISREQLIQQIVQDDVSTFANFLLTDDSEAKLINKMIDSTLGIDAAIISSSLVTKGAITQASVDRALAYIDSVLNPPLPPEPPIPPEPEPEPLPMKKYRFPNAVGINEWLNANVNPVGTPYNVSTDGADSIIYLQGTLPAPATEVI